MLLNINNMLQNDYLWYSSIAIGVIILLWFIIRDLLLHKRAKDTIRKVQDNMILNQRLSEHASQLGYVLLSFDYRMIGGNALFYKITGLTSINPTDSFLEKVSTIFPSAVQKKSQKQLEQLLHQGEGKLKLDIKTGYEQIATYEWELTSIKDKQGIIIYCLFVRSLSEIEGHTSQETQLKSYSSENLVTHMKYLREIQDINPIALFVLSIDGLQFMLKDADIPLKQFQALLRYELLQIEGATLNYMSSIDDEKLYVVLSGETIQTSVKQWAETMMEAIHHTVYLCSEEHYVVVKIGASIWIQEHKHAEIEHLVDGALAAFQMAQCNSENGYCIYPTEPS